MVTKETPDSENLKKKKLSTKQTFLIALVCVVVAAAIFAGIQIVGGNVEEVAPVPEPHSGEVAVNFKAEGWNQEIDEGATVILFTKDALEKSGWEYGKPLPEGTDEIKVVKGVKLNQDDPETIIENLNEGTYHLQIIAPVLSDGTIYKPIEMQEVEIVCEEEHHDEIVHSALVEGSFLPVAIEETTQEAIDAALIYISDQAAMEAAQVRLNAYQAAQAEAQRVAEEAAVAQTTPPESSSGWVDPGYTGGGSSGSGGGNPSGGSSGDNTPGNTGGTWNPVTTYYCNTCNAPFGDLGSLQAHQAQSQNAWLNGEDVTVHAGYSTVTG